MKNKVLIIEDDPASLMLIEDLLQAKNYDVLSTAFPNKALEEIHNFIPDIIITDINLPQMSGFELQKQVKNIPKFKQTPIIALTAIAIQKENKDSLKDDFSYHLTKPLCIKTLLSTLQNFLNK